MNREEETDIQVELKNLQKEVKRVGHKINHLQNEIHHLERSVEKGQNRIDCLQDLIDCLHRQIDYLHPDFEEKELFDLEEKEILNELEPYNDYHKESPIEELIQAYLPDFSYKYLRREHLHIFSSRTLNQIICIKRTQRKDCVTLARARQYLETNLNAVERKLGKPFVRDAYILNVLIADNLSKNCYSLAGVDRLVEARKMVMVFSTRRSPSKWITNTIFRAIATKFDRWQKEIRKTLREKNISEPYGKLKEQLDCIDNVLNGIERYLAGDKTIELEEDECRAYV